MTSERTLAVADKIRHVHLPIANTFSIDGNVASGKSTLLQAIGRIQDKYPKLIFPEPIEDHWAPESWARKQFRDSEMWGFGHSWWSTNLPRCLHDRARWQFTFQMDVFDWWRLGGNLHKLLLGHDRALKFVERSRSSAFMFCIEAHKDGCITDWEFDLLRRWKASTFEPEAHIYLRTTPETCLKRKIERGREGEELTMLDYFTRLHDLHENVFLSPEKKKEFGLPNTKPCHNELENVHQKVSLVLDGSLPAEELAIQILDWFEKKSEVQGTLPAE